MTANNELMSRAIFETKMINSLKLDYTQGLIRLRQGQWYYLASTIAKLRSCWDLIKRLCKKDIRESVTVKFNGLLVNKAVKNYSSSDPQLKRHGLNQLNVLLIDIESVKDLIEDVMYEHNLGIKTNDGGLKF